MLDSGGPCYVESQEGYEEQEMMRYFTLAAAPLALFAAGAQAQTAAPELGKPAPNPFSGQARAAHRWLRQVQGRARRHARSARDRRAADRAGRGDQARRADARQRQGV